jgi:hypothetical protein
VGASSSKVKKPAKFFAGLNESATRPVRFPEVGAGNFAETRRGITTFQDRLGKRADPTPASVIAALWAAARSFLQAYWELEECPDDSVLPDKPISDGRVLKRRDPYLNARTLPAVFTAVG